MSSLPDGWVETELRNVASHLSDGLHGTPTYDDEGEYYFINGNNLREGKVVFTKNTKRTSVEEFNKHKKDLNNRTLLVSINGTLGNVAEYNNEKCFLGKSACYFNILDDVDKLFIKYVLTNHHFQKYIERLAGGTTIKNVSLKTMREYPINLPSLPEQKSIAKLLSSFDEKIQLLREQNETLETLAQTIFKEWFVNFNYPDTTGEMVDSEFGEIPESWHVSTMDTATSLIIDHRGKTPKKLGGDWATLGYQALSAKNIKHNQIINRSSIRYVDKNLYSKWMKNELQCGDILLTSEAPMGEIYFLAGDDKYCLSQRLYALRANGIDISPSYLYFWLQTAIAKADMNGRSTGTTVVGIRQSELRKVKVLSAGKELSDKFESIAFPLLVKIQNNTDQIQTLTKTRDTLLPKLMSGEVRVN